MTESQFPHNDDVVVRISTKSFLIEGFTDFGLEEQPLDGCIPTNRMTVRMLVESLGTLSLVSWYNDDAPSAGVLLEGSKHNVNEIF